MINIKIISTKEEEWGFPVMTALIRKGTITVGDQIKGRSLFGLAKGELSASMNQGISRAPITTNSVKTT
jgi:hypothetical protein